MIKALLFSLDNTLYPEIEYRRSGLRHVAQVFAKPEHVFDLLEEFDRQTGEPIPQLAKLLLAEYHTHTPDISPYPEATAVARVGP